ncbi:MAG: Cell surface protein [Ignavibacteriae bacterium]|nr:MAG: Cell surface protein [Ignavibacteriota bacterium]
MYLFKKIGEGKVKWRLFIQLLVGGIIFVLSFQVLFSQGIIEKRESSQIKILDKNIIRDYIDGHFLPTHLREKYSRRYKATEKLNGTEEKHSHYPERPWEKHSRDTDLGEDFLPPQLRYKFDFPESNSRTVKKQDFFDAGEDLLSSQTSDTFATVWVAHYASGLVPSIDYATDIAVDASGNIYVTGYSDSLLVGYDFLTIKYNNLGVQQWVARYNGPGNGDDYATAIAVDGSGNVYVTGSSDGSGTYSDYVTIKYNSSGVQQWVARYNGAYSDSTKAIAVDGSGNVYVTGKSYVSGTHSDYVTIKYNSSGVQQWVAKYDGYSNNDYATAIAVDGSGNVYVTGVSYGSGTYEDYATIKYNSSGVQQWVARYNGPANYTDHTRAISVDGSGNVYVTGVSYGSGTNEDYATIKYNSSGVQQWVARYNGPGNGDDRATAISVDGSGNVYVTGWIVGSGTGYDYATIKYNSSGVQQWVAMYNGPGNGNDRATAISVDGSGNVYVTGSSVGSGTNEDYATIKYNSLGVGQWVARYNGPGNGDDRATAISVDGSGNVYVTGSSVGSGTNEDYATIKYNSLGLRQWVARYNGPGISSDETKAVLVDGSGNVYVTGYSYGSGTYDDYATIKYNSSGVQQWVTRYNGPGNGNDRATAMAVDGSGNVYVTGSSVGSGTGYDYATIKYNSSGVQQWVARYNGPGNDEDGAIAISVDGSGNVYVTGKSAGSGTRYDYATIKYNSSGVQQWVARYNGPVNYDDYSKAIAVDGSGNVYVTGMSVSTITYPSNYDYDYATIKYNSSGVQQWVARYNGPANYNDYSKAISVDGSGNVYVTGVSYGSGTGYDYATIKYNSSGVQQWVARYNGPGNYYDEATSLAIDGSGNVYVTGVSYGSGTNGDYATIKYNSSGEEQWVARYNGPGNYYDGATAISVDGSGNVYVTGYSYGSGTNDDYATIKYSSSGVQQWVSRYNGPTNGNDRATAISVDGSGNVYVTGVSSYRNSSIYTTIKYVQRTVNIEPEKYLLPSSYNLEQNYPNPFNPITTIKYQLPVESKVSLKIYNVLGQEIKTLVDEVQETGFKSVEWNSTDNSGKFVSSGVYFYRMDATSVAVPNRKFTDVKKLVVLK